MKIGKQVDAEKTDRFLRRLSDAGDIDHRCEACAVVPERLQSQQHVLIETPGVADDLIVRASGDGIDRFAKRAQRALIRELNSDDNGDADGDAGDGERGPRLLAEDRTDDEGEEN